MQTKKIDGYQFHNMLLNGLANIRAREEEINDLNVFPVPDGDTGTNMSLTIENGLNNATVRPEMGAYLKTLSEGMLLGARGNSGVILSQIFKGIFIALSRRGYVSTEGMVAAFIKGYKTAYEAVSKPVEGTILTVTREGIENIKTQVDKNTSLEVLLSMYISEMKKSLARTPDLMPVLKEAGVVDSGALGYITIVEGMLKYLYGEIVDSTGIYGKKASDAKGPDLSHFDENSVFNDGYCMEYILQLMNSKTDISKFNIDKYTLFLNEKGNSVVATLIGKRVKVHVHTKEPAVIIERSQQFGEFLTFKLENMQLQHNEHDEKLTKKKQEKPHTFSEIITVCDGNGIEELFAEFSCSIISTPNGMNVSSQEFVDAIENSNADHIFILPNNKNNIMSASQAIEISGNSNVHLIKTTSLIEGYYALASDIADSEDVDYRINMMNSGLESIASFSVSTANKDSSVNGKSCQAGQKVGFVGEKLVSAGQNVDNVILELLDSIENIDEIENLLLFTGKESSEEVTARVEEAINEKYPDIEITIIEGNQSIYEYLGGLS